MEWRSIFCKIPSCLDLQYHKPARAIFKPERGVSMRTSKIWAGILSGVKSQVSSSVFKTWFSNSNLLELKQSEGRDIFVVGIKNSFLKEQLEAKYKPLVLEAAKNQGFANCEFVFVVSKGDPEKTAGPEPLFSGVAPTYVSSYKKSDSLNPNHTFENFVVGPSNNLAYLALTQAAKNLGSLRSNTTQSFRQKYRSVDVLLIDDVQFFSGKESTQEEFFHPFEELHLSGRQVVVASDRHPRELGKIKE